MSDEEMSDEEMELNKQGAWMSKCSMNKFDIPSSIREILTDQFGIQAKDISVEYKMYQKSSFEAEIIDIKSTASRFPDQETFRASLKLNEKAENGENNNFGDGRKSPLMIPGNVLCVYGDKTLNEAIAYYSYADKNTLPKRWREIKGKKILKSHKECETFIRMIIYKSSKKDVKDIRSIPKCIQKPMNEINSELDPEKLEIFEDQKEKLKQIIERNYHLKMGGNPILFNGEMIQGKSRFDPKYIKVEEGGDQDLMTANLTFHMDTSGKIETEIDCGEMKGWINILTKKLKVKKHPPKNIRQIGSATMHTYYVDIGVDGIDTSKDDQTISIYRDDIIIADVPLRSHFEKASQLRSDFHYKGGDNIFELCPNKTKSTLTDKMMETVLKIIRHGTDEIFPSYKNKTITPREETDEQHGEPEMERDNIIEERRDLNPKDRETSWDKLYGAGRDATCITCNSQMINVFDTNKFQWGHIIPHSKGGPCEISNMIPICRGCNASMGNHHMFSWVKNNKSREVYNNFITKIEPYLGPDKYSENADYD